MATKPNDVAAFDQVTAADRNNLGRWVGTPLQMASWGAGFGATPPAGVELVRMRGYISVTTSSTGVATITLPSTFAGGLAWWSATSAVATVQYLRPAATGANTSTLVFVAYNAAGATVNSTAISLLWEAEGW